MSDEAEIVEFYESAYDEAARGSSIDVQIEFARTQEIVRRYLKDRGSRVADIGGGTGVHAAWLAKDGHAVTLVDPVPRHVEAARQLSPVNGSIVALSGDARDLDLADESFDAVLLLGPLYHLVDHSDRIRALVEARRILQPGGVVFAGAISRFASLHDGLATHRWFDPDFQVIAAQDLLDGQHRNPDQVTGWFTTSYFHHPNDLDDELKQAGFGDCEVFGLEGLAGWMTDLGDRWANEDDRRALMDALRAVETEPTLLGVSAHLLAVGHKPE